MSGLFNFLLFITVLIIYIHIVNQLKTSEDLEVYEMDYTTNQYLQEVCDIKQPVLFDYNNIGNEFFDKVNKETIITNDKYDIKVKDIRDYYKDESVDYIVLPLHSAVGLMKTDTKSNYFTENNDDFIESSDLHQYFQLNDTYLKPHMSLNTKYDILFGSSGVTTPLRYHSDFRKFVTVNSGKIKVKMTPWKSHNFLHPYTDMENYDFRSKINVWNPDKEHKRDFDKVRFLEFDITVGNMLYIPPYWWYSIKFDSGTDTVVTSITYNSIMNCLTNLPNWGLYYLQQTNTKTKVTKTLSMEDMVNTDEDEKVLDNTASDKQNENTVVEMTQEI